MPKESYDMIKETYYMEKRPTTDKRDLLYEKRDLRRV
jgi:hypothetical protein